jgi:gliding motility-associated-like protein
MITRSTNGCIDTLTRELVINDDLLWFIPNAFSPNQDGINELWKPEGSFIDLSDYRLEIYDRWGTRVFYTTDFDKGWNGSVAGSEFFAQEGIYNYVIKVTSLTTEEAFELTGFVMVVR